MWLSETLAVTNLLNQEPILPFPFDFLVVKHSLIISGNFLLPTALKFLMARYFIAYSIMSNTFLLILIRLLLQ